MRKSWILLGLLMVGCRATTPAEEAQAYLSDVADCLEENRDTLVSHLSASLTDGEGVLSPLLGVEECDIGELSPEATVIVEEAMEPVVGSLLPQLMGISLTATFSGAPNLVQVEALVDSMIDAVRVTSVD